MSTTDTSATRPLDRRDCTCTDTDRAADDVDPDCARHSEDTQRDYIREHRIDRSRALSWLAAQGLLLDEAYDLDVAVDGEVKVQGQPGTLGHLVREWHAVASRDSHHATWVARVPYCGAAVTVRIVEV